MKIFFSLLLLPLASLAQQAPATTILLPGRLQPVARPAANQPDRAPQYPGGADGLGLFFFQEVKYPEAARVKALTGTVLVRATVGVDGRVSEPKVASSLSPECDAEALRVVSLLQGWQPAMRRGQAIPVLVQLPVPFGNSAALKVERGQSQPNNKL